MKNKSLFFLVLLLQFSCKQEVKHEDKECQHFGVQHPILVNKSQLKSRNVTIRSFNMKGTERKYIDTIHVLLEGRSPKYFINVPLNSLLDYHFIIDTVSYFITNIEMEKKQRVAGCSKIENCVVKRYEINGRIKEKYIQLVIDGN